MDLIVIVPSAVSAVAAVTIAICAVFTARLTRSLIEENRLLRMLGQEPHVIAYLDLDERQRGGINIVLMNVGRGPARNIEYQFDFEERFYVNGRVSKGLSLDRKAIGFLPQGEKYSTFFGSSIGLFGEDRLPPFRAKVNWQNLNEKQYEEDYELDIYQFRGVSLPNAHSDQDIAESLKRISKSLEGFSSRSVSARLKVETIPSPKESRLEEQTNPNKNDPSI